MTIYTEQHYRKLMADNPHATFGFVLAARAVYASRYGSFNTADGDTPRFRNIAVDLANRYGESLTTTELEAEMKIDN